MSSQSPPKPTIAPLAPLEREALSRLFDKYGNALADEIGVVRNTLFHALAGGRVLRATRLLIHNYLAEHGK